LVGLSIGNDPGLLHKMDQMDLIAILETSGNDNANLRQEVNDYLFGEIEIDYTTDLFNIPQFW
jgi:hypothetical protein